MKNHRQGIAGGFLEVWQKVGVVSSRPAAAKPFRRPPSKTQYIIQLTE
jgi:hypothetical protein